MGAVKIYTPELLKISVLYMAARVRVKERDEADSLSLRAVTEAKSDRAAQSLDSEELISLANMLRKLGVRNANSVTERIARDAAAAEREVKSDPTYMSVVTYDRMRRQVLAELGLVSERGVQLWPPTSQTVIAHLHGRWNDALAACGLHTLAQVEHGRVRSRFTRQDHRRALEAFNAHCSRVGLRPTYSRYCDWVRDEKRPDTPSGPLLRQVYGTWRQALEVLSDEDGAEAGD